MINTPKITVILPAYNAGAFIKTAIASVLAQDFAGFELIIINDGSTDNTAGICTEYMSKDNRISLINQKNAGVSAARNAGLEQAAGEYICFLDADDYLEPDAFALMLAAIEQYSADSCICGYTNIYPGNSVEPVPAPFANGVYGFAEITGQLVLPLLSGRLAKRPLLGSACRYLFSRELIDKIPLRFTGAYLEDELFVLEYFSLPQRLAAVAKPLYNYYQNPLSATRRYMEGCDSIFLDSLANKRRLVEKYSIKAPESWELNSAWAGLLICVSNEFAPGNDKSIWQKITALRALCRIDIFNKALSAYIPKGMSRNKSIVAALLRRKLYLPLALLYAAKHILSKGR